MTNKRVRCGWDAIIFSRTPDEITGFIIDGFGNRILMIWDSLGIPKDKDKYPERYFLELV
jgi:hypothetical protein